MVLLNVEKPFNTVPPFMKVDINLHDVYLCRSMGFSKSIGSICTKHQLVFKSRKGKEQDKDIHVRSGCLSLTNNLTIAPMGGAITKCGAPLQLLSSSLIL